MATPYGFTTWDKVEQLYGSRGFENIMEDALGVYDTAVKNQMLVDAEQTIMLRLSQFYNPEDCVGNAWIESRTTWLVAHLLSWRQGNEHYFRDLYDQALRELDAMATGELIALADIPLRTDSMPAMSNFVIDDYFASQKIRVRETISVGGTYPDQHSALYGGYWGWL